MKNLKIVLLSLLGVFAAALIGLVIFLKTLDLNHYLPQITKAASDAMGRKVTIASAGLNVGFSGVVLDLNGVNVSDLIATAPPLLATDRAHAQVGLLALLTKRQIQVSTVTLTGIKINVNDPKMPLTVVVPSARVQAPDFSLTDPFTVNLDVRFASSVENMHATTKVQLNTATSQITVTNLVFNTDLAQLNMADIKAITPMLAQLPLPKSINGKINVQVPRLQMDPKGLQAVQAQLTLNIGAGSVTAEAEVANPNQLDAKAQISGIDIADLVDINALPVTVKGKLNGNVTISAGGLTPDVLLKTLKGQGSANIDGGTIGTQRLFEAMLGPTLGKIPGLGEAIGGIITSTLQSKLGSDTIALDKAQAQFTIADSIVTLNDAAVSSRAFELGAQGTVGFNMATAISVTMLIAPDLSADLVKQAKPLEYLQDTSGRIKVEGQMLGVIPAVKFVPSVNVKNVAANALMKEGGNQLQKVIEKNPAVGNLLNSFFGGK